ncbi:Gfo/Idh/MocA family oxidoreductase, partial [Paraglaciecola sp.]
MSKQIKVLICGTGFAGQGHGEAFRNVGAELVGIVGRTESVVKQVAKDMDIPYAGTDWQQALIDCQPDVVSIATPGGAHVEPIKQAIEFGCHIFSDKPLTACGESAKE